MHSFDDFSYTAPTHSIPSHLYTLTRMGCTQVPNSFKITRDASYRYHVLHYVYGGKGLLTINQTHHKLEQGNCFILGPGKPHIYASEETSPLKLIWIEFHGSNTSDLMNLVLSKHIHLLSTPYTEVILLKLMVLMDTLKSTKVPSPLLLSEQIYSFIIHLIDQALLSYNQTTPLSPVLPPHIQKSLEFIDAHLFESIKINTLAENIGCSPSYLSRSFSHYMGISPYKYILIKKIEYALIRILTEDVTAAKLAEELGFVDTTHFTKSFKKITGKSISSYKKGD